MVLSSSGIGLQASSSPGSSCSRDGGFREAAAGGPSGGRQERDGSELPLEPGEDFAVGADVQQADRQLRGFRQRDAEGPFSGRSPGSGDPASGSGASLLASAMDLSCRRISGSRWDAP